MPISFLKNIFKPLHQLAILVPYRNGLPFKRRDGRYYCLDHERADAKSPDVLENRSRFEMRENSKNIAKEGLSNLEYKTLNEITLEPDVFFITVEV